MVDLVVSPRGEQVLRHEIDSGVLANLGESVTRHEFGNLASPIASGSCQYDAMAIVPASMGTVGRLAAGCSNDLVGRAGDVCLKERRRLVIAPRETPMSLIHLRALATLAEAGAIIMPAAPAFHGKPTTLDELVDGFVGRILDALGIDNDLVRRWSGEL
jgi:4-hydroxy-3-polyprenylbenzoate decarboxylase